jgi:excisionase family DNA binding protein
MTYLTVAETADLLRVSESTVRRMIARREIKTFRAGVRVLIDRDKLIADLEAGRLGNDC